MGDPRRGRGAPIEKHRARMPMHHLSCKAGPDRGQGPAWPPRPGGRPGGCAGVDQLERGREGDRVRQDGVYVQPRNVVSDFR